MTPSGSRAERATSYSKAARSPAPVCVPVCRCTGTLTPNINSSSPGVGRGPACARSEDIPPIVTDAARGGYFAPPTRRLRDGRCATAAPTLSAAEGSAVLWAEPLPRERSDQEQRHAVSATGPVSEWCVKRRTPHGYGSDRQYVLPFFVRIIVLCSSAKYMAYVMSVLSNWGSTLYSSV